VIQRARSERTRHHGRIRYRELPGDRPGRHEEVSRGRQGDAQRPRGRSAGRADYNSLSIEGDAPPTTIVLRFASVEAARGWYDSPEYQAIKDLRIDNSGEGRLVIAESFAPRA
jgi:hypothetical protein